jgi:hypothetical protein
MENFKGASELSIEAGDMEDLLKKNEYLDMKEFVDQAEEREKLEQQKREQAAARANKRRGK